MRHGRSRAGDNGGYRYNDDGGDREERMTEDLPVSTQDNGAGGKYYVGGKGTEESAYEITEWNKEETDDLAIEEKYKTTGGGQERSD